MEHKETGLFSVPAGTASLVADDDNPDAIKEDSGPEWGLATVKAPSYKHTRVAIGYFQSAF